MTPSPRPLRWDLFCRVIDNLGDAGVCWRLAADLGARGHSVRLWIDDASMLAWMAPRGASGVTVHAWHDAATEAATEAEVGDVVVEAFGCDPPAAFVQRMAARTPAPPHWINLEYLSAEDYVERSHRLPSPQFSGPGAGLVKHFFYPGFTPATGGLLREPDLLARRSSFDRVVWCREQGLAVAPDERVALVFCYPDAPLGALARVLRSGPDAPAWHLLLAQGAAQQLGRDLDAGHAWPARVRATPLPWLTQTDFDCALWSADLAIVRGEDSFVRAQWAGVPFIWQIYRQDDGAHRAKREAFLARHLADAEPALAHAIRALWVAFDDGVTDLPALPSLGAWRAQAVHWRAQLLAQDDLVTQLAAFVDGLAGARRA